jgi:hypothetical protein
VFYFRKIVFGYNLMMDLAERGLGDMGWITFAPKRPVGASKEHSSEPYGSRKF